MMRAVDPIRFLVLPLKTSKDLYSTLSQLKLQWYVIPNCKYENLHGRLTSDDAVDLDTCRVPLCLYISFNIMWLFALFLLTDLDEFGLRSGREPQFLCNCAKLYQNKMFQLHMNDFKLT
jgi:hypothetical protein